MTKIALFPCKANPPHLGHIIALLRIKDDYDKIIIDFLDVELMVSVNESITILKEILDNFPDKFGFTTHKISYAVENNFSKIPKCSIIVTGNKRVYKNMKKHGFKVRLVKRVPIYRGEFMREAYMKGLKHERKTNISFLKIITKKTKILK